MDRKRATLIDRIKLNIVDVYCIKFCKVSYCFRKPKGKRFVGVLLDCVSNETTITEQQLLTFYHVFGWCFRCFRSNESENGRMHYNIFDVRFNFDSLFQSFCTEVEKCFRWEKSFQLTNDLLIEQLSSEKRCFCRKHFVRTRSMCWDRN